MVPQTYPSVYNTYTNRTEMVVYELTSISGKVRWTDYIPVKMTTSTNAAKDNTTDSDGCIPISPLGSITNKQAFTDYIPIYVDNSATDAWAVSATGYIPYGISSAAIGILKRFGNDAHVYLPGIGTLSGLTAANYLDSALTTPATVDNPVGGVVDAIGVINATQPTTAAKPRLERGVRNLLTYSQDFSNAAWSKADLAAGSWSFGAGAQDPFGGTSAFTASLSGSRFFRQSSVPTTAGATYTQAVWIRSSASGGAANIRLTTNNVTAWNTGYSTKVALTSSWQLLVTSGVAQTGNTIAHIIYGTVDATGTLDASCYGNVDVYSAALFQGTLTAAQILDSGGIPLTTTAAASNPSAGKYSWAFDGGDSLALGSVPFQMSNDHAVIVGFTCSNDAAARVVTSVYGAATTAFAAQIYQLTNTVIVEWRDDASATCSPAAQTVPLGTTVVISGRRVGNTSTSRKNGGSALTATATLGASTLNTAAIGANRFGNNMQGNTGPIIDIKGTLTDSELLTLERVVASLTPNAPSF